MGYFSNGTEGEDYQDRYCARCVNWRDNGSGSEGCPIMDLHFVYNYDQFDDVTANTMLSVLIPKKKDSIFNGECAMFQERK